MVDCGCTDLAYETVGGQQVLVRSLNSDQKVFLRFFNQSCHAVNIWWRDYQGLRKHYALLGAGTIYEVDSYLTHPWEVTDYSTKQRYLIDHQSFYRAPVSLAGKTERITLNITATTQDNC